MTFKEFFTIILMILFLVPMVSSGGVTIQKATIGIAGQTAPGSITRTIALPYGTTSSIVTTSQQQHQPTSLATSGKLVQIL
jgi:hypothetical protein